MVTAKLLADLIEAQRVYVKDICQIGREPEDLTNMTVDGVVDFVRLSEEINRAFDGVLTEEICSDCKHSLKDNQHGFDQNDAHLDGDKLIHHGRCTYCNVCQDWSKRVTAFNDNRNPWTGSVSED